jgi:hypothetical protein
MRFRHHDAGGRCGWRCKPAEHDAVHRRQPTTACLPTPDPRPADAFHASQNRIAPRSNGGLLSGPARGGSFHDH